MLFFKKKFLGIDIGSSAIKAVEFSSFGKKIKLENFGEVPAKAFLKPHFRTFEKKTLSLSFDEIVKAIKFLLEEAEIKTKEAFFSIPDFSTFLTVFEIPPMLKKEIPLTIKVEAKRRIPLPLSEVFFDWQILKEFDGGKKGFEILLAAVPYEVINQYQMIVQKSGLKLISLESEVFSLARVFGEEGKTILILDFGARTTSCNIVENKILKRSFSFDFGGDFLSERIANALGVGFEEGESLKKEFGLQERGGKVREVLIPLLSSLFSEVGRIIFEYERKEKREIEKVILTGGGALLPDLLEYSKIQLKKEVEIKDPFEEIFYPPILEKTIKEIGPSFSVASGLALRGFQKKWK